MAEGSIPFALAYIEKRTVARIAVSIDIKFQMLMSVWWEVLEPHFSAPNAAAYIEPHFLVSLDTIYYDNVRVNIVKEAGHNDSWIKVKISEQP